MARYGNIVLTFSTQDLRTSEVIDLSFSQKWTIAQLDTIAKTTLTQRGSIGLGVVKVKAVIYNDCAIVIPAFYTLFRAKTLANLTANGINYGNYYFESLDFTYTDFDEAQAPLRGEMELSFLEALENY